MEGRNERDVPRLFCADPKYSELLHYTQTSIPSIYGTFNLFKHIALSDIVSVAAYFFIFGRVNKCMHTLSLYVALP